MLALFFTSDAVHSHSEAAFSILLRYRIGVLKLSAVVDRTLQKEKFAEIVDISKAIIPQIPKLGNQYSDWVHAQCGLKEIIIFDNFLELFTRWPWWYIFILWTPFIVYSLRTALQHVSFVQTVLAYCIGGLSWSLLEYTLHRFVFHISTDTTMWNYFHFFAHGIHHITPNDHTRLTFPPTFSAVIMFGIGQLPGSVVPYWTGVNSYLAGLATGFVLYDTAHYYFHHGDIAWLPTFFHKAKSSHLNHHYKNDKANFGVTSPLFDWVFGTLAKTPLQAAS